MRIRKFIRKPLTFGPPVRNYKYAGLEPGFFGWLAEAAPDLEPEVSTDRTPVSQPGDGQEHSSSRQVVQPDMATSLRSLARWLHVSHDRQPVEDAVEVIASSQKPEEENESVENQSTTTVSEKEVQKLLGATTMSHSQDCVSSSHRLHSKRNGTSIKRRLDDI